MSFLDWVSGRVFHAVHGNNLVYNTCWEDPRLDRVALDIGDEDEVMVITSAGCNALDYALAGAKRVHAVDMNPRQNALLELKKAAIRRLDYDDYFAMFGVGRLPRAKEAYQDALRGELSDWARRYWDRWIKFFANKRHTFYFRGTSGAFARGMNAYINKVIRLRPFVDELLSSETLEEQRETYQRVRERLWTRTIQFAMKRDTTLSMLGVPKAQRRQIETQYEGGIFKYVQDCVDAVFGELPIQDNYFWRVYMTGSYTPACCPEYLKRDNFERLKAGLLDRVCIHTDTVQGFLDKHDGRVSRFVLLDHMDWLSDRLFPLLESEWQSIVDRAATDARVIWRSGGLRTDFLNRVEVRVDGRVRPLPELLTYHRKLAAELHAQDRVHTYGSFYIADVAA